MRIRWISGTAAALFLLVIWSCFPAADIGKPNIVVILADEQGWGDLSVTGNRNLETPNIDSLAAEGAIFDRFYVSPVCSPTRAEFLTGRYHPRGGVFSTSAGGERLDLDETTIAETFKAAGYITGAFGKWHNGTQYPYHPNGRGFDEFYGFCSGHWGDYFSPLLEHNGILVKGEGYVTNDFTNRALAFIEQNREKPFFCYIPYNTPHSPMQVPDRFWERFEGRDLAMRHREPERENEEHTRAALAMCENIDWNVGRILRKLEDLEISSSTIVVYFSDNGPNGYRYNGGMKGRKGSTDEGGVRSPLLIRWPGKIPAGRIVSQIAGAIDLLPTLADCADIPVTAHQPLDGISLKQLLLHRNVDWPDRMIFSHWRGNVSVRTQRYRLDRRGALFDMIEDPGQYTDISREKPQVTARLASAVSRWKSTVLNDLGETRRPFVLGHPDARFTQLPARDGKAHGQVKRSNRFPNCSYFTNWTDLDDRITWDVEVASEGTFRVTIYYTCPPGDVGSTFKLSLGDHSLNGTISEAHDPPLRGMEHDRIKRTESYVKDFRPLDLGLFRMDKEEGQLTLQAITIPGNQVMEVRLLMFERVE